ncbi:hypothetical protein ACKFKG_31915 [Phormidesmis sp. 146-35]
MLPPIGSVSVLWKALQSLFVIGDRVLNKGYGHHLASSDEMAIDEGYCTISFYGGLADNL